MEANHHPGREAYGSWATYVDSGIEGLTDLITSGVSAGRDVIAAAADTDREAEADLKAGEIHLAGQETNRETIMKTAVIVAGVVLLTSAAVITAATAFGADE